MGFVWEPRDISIWYNGSPPSHGLNGVGVADNHNAVIYQTPSGFSQPGRHYHWEGRQLINTGDKLRVFVLDDGWTFRITGYQLTAP